MELRQVIDILNIGIVIINKQYEVLEWNQWMTIQTGKSKDSLVGKVLLDFYPNLNEKSFIRSCKAVFTFGNIVFLSQKLHKYLIPVKLKGSQSSLYDYMQQSIVLAPIRDEEKNITSLVITIQDVTENVINEQRLNTLNMQDGLTNVFNRRYLDVRINEEFLRHMRYSNTMSVIMIDIDNFKFINDTYGHQFGDDVIKTIAFRTSSALRGADVIARYGGEEFCCLLPETPLREGEVVAERIRSSIEENSIEYNDKEIFVTISLGVASMTNGVLSSEILLKNADTALYEAKKSGKNKVVLFQL